VTVVNVVNVDAASLVLARRQRLSHSLKTAEARPLHLGSLLWQLRAVRDSGYDVARGSNIEYSSERTSDTDTPGVNP
jgi:hypothetical protein